MSTAFAVAIALLLAAPGVRLLRAAVRERREPELWLGATFVLIGLGLGLRFYAALPIATGRAAGYVLPNLAGHLCVALSALSLYVFVWRVFRPLERGVRWLVAGIGLAIAVDFVWMVQSGGHLVERHPSVVVANALRGAVLPWVFGESLRYRRMMKRRIALGIGDPVVANRFTLWAIWSGAFSALPIFVLAARLLAEGGEAGATLVAVLPFIRVILLAGVGSAIVCIWLSFFPPRAYLDRLRSGPTTA